MAFKVMRLVDLNQGLTISRKQKVQRVSLWAF